MSRLSFFIKCSYNVYSFAFINYSRFRLATVLYFATIVFDDARPKVFLCSRETYHRLSCLLSKNSKNVLFLHDYDIIGKKSLDLTISGKQIDCSQSKRSHLG